MARKCKRVRTDEEVLAAANELARTFYRAMGYVGPAGYRFDRARHPQEKLCWTLAVIAYADLADTDLDDTLSAVED